MGKRIRQKYSTEFKLSAVNMVISSDKSVAQISANLGVNTTTLYSWVNHPSAKRQLAWNTPNWPMEVE